MKIVTNLPQDQVFWYINKKHVQPLSGNISTDVLVVGGGMAGLSAAQRFAQQGYKVVLIEKNYIGSGASGKSSGFITPNSELGLSSLIDFYGAAQAKRLWDFVTSGVNHIRDNIEQYKLDCDYQVQDTLALANSGYKFRSEIQPEHQARIQLDYASQLYAHDQLPAIIGSNGYKGGVAYGGSFGIHAYRYCLGMQQVLQQEFGVQIFEETPAIEIQDNYVRTPHGSIKAAHIIVATDYCTTESLRDYVYHVQTFLALSAPLAANDVTKIFPNKAYMVWDTDLIYHYYRLTGDNRLLLGGANLFYTYARHEKHNSACMSKKLQRYFAEKFPEVSLQFEYMWPGLIGVSKDLFPIAGVDEKMPSVYYIAAATGLPWAAALGGYSAERIITNTTSFDQQLSPYRSYKLGEFAQHVMGKRLTFALSNFLTVGSL